jgi:hypothetical protein
MTLSIFFRLAIYFIFVFASYLIGFYMLLRSNEKKFYQSLEEKLKSDDPLDRLSAIVKMSAIGVKAKDFVPALIQLLNDENEDVVKNSRDALLEIRANIKKVDNKCEEIVGLIDKYIPKNPAQANFNFRSWQKAKNRKSKKDRGKKRG